MTIWIWANIGSGNGLVPDGIKPLPEQMLTSYYWGFLSFDWEQNHSLHANILHSEF